MKLKNKLLLGGLTAVLLAVMSFSAWKIWVIRSEYHTGEAAYEDISHMISLPQKTAEPQPPVINKPAGAETLPDEDDTVWPEVDFAALREINPDNRARTHIQFFSQSTLCYLLLDSLLPKFEGKKVKKVHQKSPLLYFMVSSNSAKYTPNSCQMSYTSQIRNM